MLEMCDGLATGFPDLGIGIWVGTLLLDSKVFHCAHESACMGGTKGLTEGPQQAIPLAAVCGQMHHSETLQSMYKYVVETDKKTRRMLKVSIRKCINFFPGG